MAKFWIQYDAASGTYVPWEANTPPSPESVHRARFLSQFPAWIKYLSAMEGTEPALWFPCGNGSCATDHSFIYPASGTGEDRHIGTIIQTASFWNMLNWKPSEKWINVAEEELVVDAVLEDPTKPLVETDAYAETETADIYAGEVIHPGHAESQILEWLWNLRKRIDLCVALRGTLVRRGPVALYHHVNWYGVEGFDPWVIYITYDGSDSYPWGYGYVPPGFTGFFSLGGIPKDTMIGGGRRPAGFQ